MSALRCSRTARWLIEPLSVTSPRSIDSGVSNSTARVIRVEEEAGVEIIGIGGLQRIAEFVEAFLVERRRRQFRLTPIARRDVRALGAHFQLAVVGQQLCVVTEHWKPDMAGAAGVGTHGHE